MIVYRSANGMRKVLTRNHFRQHCAEQKPIFVPNKKVDTNAYEFPIEIWTQILEKTIIQRSLNMSRCFLAMASNPKHFLRIQT